MKICFFCQSQKPKPPLRKWFEEQCYGGTLRTAKDYQKNYLGSNYYCSLACLCLKQDKERAEWIEPRNHE